MTDQQPDPATMSVRGDQNVQIQHVAGSTITVTFGGGPPREVPLSPATVPMGERVRSPARLLRARSGVIGYSARDGLLHDLQAWAVNDLAFAAMLIGGSGGSGKTRLGVEMCERRHADGWLAGLLKPEADPAALETLLHVPVPRLVVIDYAEARVEQLKIILPLLASRATAATPVRIMLLVRDQPRSGDWAQALRNRDDALDAVLDELDVHALDDLPLDLTDRKRLFERAVQSIAHRTATRSDATPPTNLEEAAFASPLLVVIAAYLRVHGQTDIPTTKAALLDELLQHETRYWRATAAAGDRDDDELLRRVIALSTLAGAASEHDAAKLLCLVPDLADATEERRRQLARWAQRAYPGPRYWNALEPDLIAEHLVNECFQHAPEVLGGVLDRDNPADVVHPLTFYARAAKDGGELRQALRTPIGSRLEQLTALAIRQAASAKQLDLLLGTATIAGVLSRLLQVVAVDHSAAITSHNLLPQRPNLILSPLGLQLTATIVDALRTVDASDVHRRALLASALNNFCNRLGETGDHRQALTAIQEAVDIYRALAADDPAAFNDNLARSLNNLSNSLSEAGERQQALIAIQEAVDIYRALTADDPAAFTDSLAISLNNLSNRLGDTGHHRQALTAIQEAVDIRRRLAADNPAAFTPSLASSLNNLSNSLSDTGHPEQALAAIQEAVDLYRALAVDNPAAFNNSLASSLNNLSNRLGDTGHHGPALTAIQEAVDIYRALAADNPAAFTPSLASSLHNLSSSLSHTGGPEQALTAIQEAVALRRRLAADHPAAFTPELASSLNNLSNRLSDAGDHGQALTAIQEAVHIYRALAADHPAASAFNDNLAKALNNLSHHLSDAGDHEQALIVRREAATLSENADAPTLRTRRE